MSLEHRTTYRYTTVEPISQAVIQADQKSVVLDLVDQSAGGFGIESLKNLNLQPGQIVKLRTNAGWSECEVIHQESEPGTTRIGLRRLNDLPDVRMEQALHQTSLPQFSVGSSLNSESTLAQVLTMALLAAAGFWLAVSHPVWLPKLQKLYSQSVPAPLRAPAK